MSKWSLCMIVKDEETVLRRCLESTGSLFDEIIIADTGSSDLTKEIARLFTDRIFDCDWQDDFAAARNFAFAKATGDYIMWLDADDVIPSGTLKALEEKKADTNGADVIMLPYETAFDEDGKATFSFYRERIIKRSPQCVWVGAVHEVIVPFGNITKLNAPIKHLKEKGYDGARNLRIYEKLLSRGEKLDARHMYYYGRELLANGRYSEAEAVFSEFLARDDGWIENKLDAARQLAFCRRAAGKPGELDALLSALSYGAPRAELCCDIGRCFYERSELNAAVFWYRSALTAGTSDEGFISEECKGFLPCIMLCLCCYGLGDIKKSFLYNEAAGAFRPRSPFYLKNKQFFRDVHGLYVSHDEHNADTK